MDTDTRSCVWKGIGSGLKTVSEERKREKPVRPVSLRPGNLPARIIALVLIICLGLTVPDAQELHAGTADYRSALPKLETSIKKLDIDYYVRDVEAENNWEGVTNISYVGERNGNALFAVDFGDLIAVYECLKEEATGVDKEGTEVREVFASDPICIMKENPLFGGVICDGEGFLYVVTGTVGDASSQLPGYVYVTKYSPEGDMIGQVIDDGASSLGIEAGTEYLNLEPFNNGNCVLEINNGVLAVYYARKMISGHQSDSLFLVNTDTLEEVVVGRVYQSHSFAQRAVPYGKGFLLVSEGDCYDRAFVVTKVNNKFNTKSSATFHFGVKPGTLDNVDMAALNNNFAHLGDIAMLGNGRAVLAATSARSMKEKAEKEAEDIFIQIFNPKKDLTTKKAYVGGKKRKGLSGGNGDTSCTDYGVRWITKLKKNEKISSLHCVVTEDDTIVLLYEKQNEDGHFEGVFYTLLDKNGDVIVEEMPFWNRARLPRGESPVCTGNRIWWIGNAMEDYCLCVYTLVINPA